MSDNATWLNFQGSYKESGEALWYQSYTDGRPSLYRKLGDARPVCNRLSRLARIAQLGMAIDLAADVWTGDVIYRGCADNTVTGEEYWFWPGQSPASSVSTGARCTRCATVFSRCSRRRPLASTRCCAAGRRGSRRCWGRRQGSLADEGRVAGLGPQLFPSSEGSTGQVSLFLAFAVVSRRCWARCFHVNPPGKPTDVQCSATATPDSRPIVSRSPARSFHPPVS